MQGAVWWLRPRLVKLLNAKNPWKIPAWPENSVSTQHEPQSFLLFEKLDLFTSKTRSDSGPVFYQTHQGHCCCGLGVEHHHSRGISFRDEANAKDTAEFVYFSGIFNHPPSKIRKFWGHCHLSKKKKKKDLKGLFKYFLHWSFKDRMTMLLSFHVFSIKNWHSTSLIVVIHKYMDSYEGKHHSILISATKRPKDQPNCQSIHLLKGILLNMVPFPTTTQRSKIAQVRSNNFAKTSPL